jgi:hypothetical protein
MAANKLNLKNIDSPSELFEYIYKLEKDLEEKDNFIDSQIVYIASLHTEIDALRQKLKGENTSK